MCLDLRSCEERHLNSELVSLLVTKFKLLTVFAYRACELQQFCYSEIGVHTCYFVAALNTIREKVH
jgi:hypothetical protein